MAIADKLQKLVNGKQYVIDKTNAKAETSLPINCTWEELGDTIEGIESGIDTTDATAVSGDIRLGKTAYVGTGKISGTIEDYDGAYEGEAEKNVFNFIVPSVSNLVVSDKGVASWDAPDFTELEDFDYTYIYIVKVNGKEMTTTNASISLKYYLKEGANIISVVVSVIITTIKDSKEIILNKEYSLPSYSIAYINTTLPRTLGGIGVATIGTNVYLFGGQSTSSIYATDTIYKFDTTTETLTTLSTKLPRTLNNIGVATIGTNVYLFGGNYSGSRFDKIYKFDTTTETITTLSTTLVNANYGMGVATIGANVYLFGGYENNYSNAIYKFDTTTETITTLSTTLPNKSQHMGVATIGTNVYLFGGSYGNSLNTIYKFDTITETITTLSTKFARSFYGMGVATIGTNVYLFGGNDSSYYNKIYKFDTTTETLTTLSTTLVNANYGMGVATIGANVYLFGGQKDYATFYNTILKFTE